MHILNIDQKQQVVTHEFLQLFVSPLADTQLQSPERAALETSWLTLASGHMEPENPQRPTTCTVMWTNLMVRNVVSFKSKKHILNDE